MKSKIILFLVVLLFVGCQSPQVTEKNDVDPLPSQVAGTAIPSDELDIVRNKEEGTEYIFGNYADPNHPEIRYTGGKLDRIEKEATWNLKGNKSASLPSGPLQKPKSTPNEVPNILKNEMIQEVEKTKAQNQALVQQAEEMNKRLENVGNLEEKLGKLIQMNELLIQQNQQTKKDNEQLNQKLQKVEDWSKQPFYKRVLKAPLETADSTSKK